MALSKFKRKDKYIEGNASGPTDAKNRRSTKRNYVNAFEVSDPKVKENQAGAPMTGGNVEFRNMLDSVDEFEFSM